MWKIKFNVNSFRQHHVVLSKKLVLYETKQLYWLLSGIQFRFFWTCNKNDFITFCSAWPMLKPVALTQALNPLHQTYYKLNIQNNFFLITT